MTDTNSTPNTPQPSAPETGRRDCSRNAFSGRRRWLALGAVLVIGLVGFGIGRATSWHSARHFGQGFGSGIGMHRTMDAETAARRADVGINRVLSNVDATPEQKAKIAEIAKAAIKDLMPLRETHNGLRDKLAAALKSEKIDRAQIEQLRTEQLALGETLSKRAAQALSDAADLLTPPQRAKLVERWQSRSWRG